MEMWTTLRRLRLAHISTAPTTTAWVPHHRQPEAFPNCKCHKLVVLYRQERALWMPQIGIVELARVEIAIDDVAGCENQTTQQDKQGQKRADQRRQGLRQDPAPISQTSLH